MRDAKQADFTPFNAVGWKLGVVVAQFNKPITDQLYKSTLKRAADYQLSADSIDVINVAGSIEIPVALQKMAKSGQYRALLALGCVIKGETPHFEYVCKLVTEGILRVQLDHQIPVGFGILTCLNKEQAEARAGLGGDYLDAILQLAKSLE